MTNDFALDSIEFYRDADLADLEIRRSFYRSSAFSKHTHDTFSLSTVLRGEGDYHCRGGSYRITSGHTIVIPRDVVHACNPCDGSSWGYLMFHLSDGYVRELALDLAQRPPMEIRFDEHVLREPAIGRRMVHLYELVRDGASILEKEATLVDTIADLLIGHAKLGSYTSPVSYEPRSVAIAKEYLAENLEKNVSMHELSVATGVSGFHLLRIFRTAVGMPPHAYQVQMRVKEARRLLLKGYSIVESALSTGFYDQSHFTNKFKRIVGLTPREYVTAHRSSRAQAFPIAR